MAEANRAFKRRRIARIAGVTAVLGAVAGLMLYAAADTRKGEQPNPGASVREEGSEGPCPRTRAPRQGPKRFPSPPDLSPAPNTDYSALIRTTCGDIEIDLLEDRAPKTVANFVFLAREGFYDGLLWHRVEPNVLIETGDPTGRIDDSSDGPGYAIPDELPSKGSEYVYGTVAMANAGPNTGGSRFFIVVHDPEQDRPAGFPPAYSIFGRVDQSTFATIENIAKVPTRGGDDPAVAFQPVDPVYVKTIEVIEE